MDILNLITPQWIQAGELGLAFVVIILMSGLVTYVVKSSTRREQEYLKIITTTLPMLQGIATGMANINLRLESIEENQMRLWNHKAPNKMPRKKSNTKPLQVADVEEAVAVRVEEIKLETAEAAKEVSDAKVD